MGLLAMVAGGLMGQNLEAQEAPSRPIPFRGKIKAVDKEAKTITLDERTERVFHVTKETRLTKDGREATFDDAKVGLEIGGTYRRSAEGKLEAASLRFGPRPEPAPRAGRNQPPAE